MLCTYACMYLQEWVLLLCERHGRKIRHRGGNGSVIVGCSLLFIKIHHVKCRYGS